MVCEAIKNGIMSSSWHVIHRDCDSLQLNKKMCRQENMTPREQENMGTREQEHEE